MPSSTSSSDTPAVVSAERLTAADRPGVAQPVPERPVPPQPWRALFGFALLAFVAMLALWEWRMRQLGLEPGDLDDGASAWAEERRRIDAGDVRVAIVGDSRILFDTDLARFHALTGERPVQLALPGTNARPFLEDLAADPDFTGLAIVGITDGSYFRNELGLMAGALDRYRKESPAQRSSFVLHRALSRVFGFLDDSYRFSVLMRRLDRGLRPGTRGPYNEVWKIATTGEARQTFLWERLRTDAFLREHAWSLWMAVFAGRPSPDDAIANTLDRTAKAVAAIRARGGDVVFVEPPSDPKLRALEEAGLPRSKGWDALLAAVGLQGVHFQDEPSMQNLELPELSHLSRACATVFTDAYVRALASRTGRLSLRNDAPPPLSPDDC
jgi:hypothetical protein